MMGLAEVGGQCQPITETHSLAPLGTVIPHAISPPSGLLFLRKRCLGSKLRRTMDGFSTPTVPYLYGYPNPSVVC